MVDDEYICKGVASIFLAVDPLGGKHEVRITEQRTRIEWASFIRKLLDDRYPDAKKIVLFMDNLNTHDTGSLSAAFPAEEARRLSQRLEYMTLPSTGVGQIFRKLNSAY
ncbi:transposase [Desulfolutivibrio sp.]|uniref:transposase n=1 Tax=Desulfolutivibrio sp. TaxID=2773296 RepID=UPI003FA41A04